MRELACSRAELQAQCRAFGFADVGAQRLHPWPIRRGSSRFPAAADQNSRATDSCVCDELLGEAALPDSWLAGEQEDASSARQSILEARKQLLHLRCAADKRTP